MQQKEIEIRVFFIPGGEQASLFAYDKLVELLETHDDLFLSVYRGRNPHDETWSIILIGEKGAFSRYHHQIQHPLSEVHAQPINVPLENLASFVERFLAKQAEMLQTNETLVEKHYPLKKKQYPVGKNHSAKKQTTRQSKRGKKRH